MYLCFLRANSGRYQPYRRRPSLQYNETKDGARLVGARSAKKNIFEELNSRVSLQKS